MPLWPTCHHAGVGSFLLIVVAAIILSGIVFGAAAFTLGRDRGLTPPRPDGVPFDLPADRPLDRPDVEDIRFDTAIRGYRMDQVDDILHRIADDFDFLHARIIDLEDQLAAHSSDDDEERPFEFPWVDGDRPEATAEPTTRPADTAAEPDPTAPDAPEPSSTTSPGSASPTVAATDTTPAGAAASAVTGAPDTTASGAAKAPEVSETPGVTKTPGVTAAAEEAPPVAAGGDRAGSAADVDADLPEIAEVAAPPSGRGR